MNLQPRWGHGRPTHPRLHTVLDRNRTDYDTVITEIAGHHELLHGIQQQKDPGRPTEPFWMNPWFSALDAASLVSFLLTLQPKRYVEIGSGHSTMFTRYTIRHGALPTTITSIDPQPRAEIDAICDRTLRSPLEECDLAIFDELQRGDILFFDGSHEIWTNSDVTTFFLDILPRLTPGVLVHVHDIFLPDDYPPAWMNRRYTEQYILAAMLMCGAPPFRVRLPNYFVSQDDALSARVREIFRPTADGSQIPTTYEYGVSLPPLSFWFETLSATTA